MALFISFIDISISASLIYLESRPTTTLCSFRKARSNGVRLFRVRNLSSAPYSRRNLTILNFPHHPFPEMPILAESGHACSDCSIEYPYGWAISILATTLCLRMIADHKGMRPFASLVLVSTSFLATSSLLIILLFTF
jgi:hypothetical protein